MWKSLVFAAGVLVGISSAGPASWSEDISVHNNHAVTGIHYSQHESSVNAARRAAADRLQQSAALVASGSGSSGPCETLCYMSADAGDAETIGQGIVGFTSSGGATSGTSQKYSSSSSRHESSVQNAVAAPIVYPVASTGTRSSFSSSSSSRQHTASSAAQPVLGQLYSPLVRDHAHSGNVIATSGIREGTYIQPLVYPVPAPQTHASQSSYERSSSVVTRPASTASVVYVPTADTAASNTFNTRSSYVSSSSADQQHLQPVAYSSGANSDYARRNEFTSQQQDLQYRQQYPAKGNTYVLYSKPMPASVQYYGAPSRSRIEDSSTSSTAYDSSGRVVNLNIVQPALTERHDEQRTQRVQSVHQSVQQPEATYGTRAQVDHVDGDTLVEDEVETDTSVPVSGGTSSSSHRREHSYVRTGSYTPTVAPTGSNRYSSSSQTSEAQRRQTYHSAPGYVQVVPVAGAGSVASSKYESASEHQQRHSSGGYVPVPVQPVSTGAASSSTSRHASSNVQEQRSNTYSNPGGYYTAGTGGAGYGSQYSSQSSSSHSNRYSKPGSTGFQHYPIANDELGRRFGASGGSPGGLGVDADLHNIMSETESLARVQAQNVHNGAVAGSGTIDTDTRFGGSSTDDAGLGTMPGGFQRTKSWSSSSKWASEQRYGDGGKPKTYSMLSTAESEKHNINGKTTGYKAATTTLEDDGKVSTYSLHTT